MVRYVGVGQVERSSVTIGSVGEGRRVGRAVVVVVVEARTRVGRQRVVLGRLVVVGMIS